MSRDGVPVGELSATNDPIPHANKRLLVQLYQAHPLLKTILDQASGKKVGEWVTAVDPAHGLDHSAVTVFEKQPDGSLTMVASDTQAELRPPIKCTGNGQYWVEWVGHDIREVWEWVMNDARHPDGIWRRPDGMLDYPQCAYGVGWRYLGPAEWRAPDDLGLNAAMCRSRDAALRRIAVLETENAALRTERDYERARYAALAPPMHLGPRAHDLGVPTTPRTVGELMGWSASSKAEDPNPGERLEFNGQYVYIERTRDPLVVRLLHSVEGITPGLVALDYLEKALASPFGTLPAIHRAVEAATQDPHPTHPTDEVHEAVERVIGHIADGKVTQTGRQALRGALDKAETPPTGRAASVAAIGRIARLA